MEKELKVLTIKQQVYQIIKNDICKGVYEPGQQINEIELSNRLGISRSPIRESLRQLVSDGLAVEYPNRGVFVKEFSLEEMKNIYDYRVLIESYAINNCSRNINEKTVSILEKCRDNLQQFYSEGNLTSYIEEDSFLHMTIVDLCDNQIVIDSYEKVNAMNNQFRSYSLVSRQRFDESIDEHAGIINSIISGDYNKAIELNRVHLTRARDTVIANLKK